MYMSLNWHWARKSNGAADIFGCLWIMKIECMCDKTIEKQQQQQRKKLSSMCRRSDEPHAMLCPRCVLCAVCVYKRMRLTSAERAEIIFNLVKNALASSASVSPHCRVNCLDAAVYMARRKWRNSFWYCMALDGLWLAIHVQCVHVCIIVKYYPRNMWNSDASEFSV